MPVHLLATTPIIEGISFSSTFFPYSEIQQSLVRIIYEHMTKMNDAYPGLT